MLIQYAQIDDSGNFVRDRWLDDPIKNTDTTLIMSPVPEGFHIPKWNGSAWVEGLSDAELLALAQAQKIAELQTAFAQAVTAGFTSSADGTSRTYALDSQAFQKWTAALAIVNAGSTANIAMKDLAGNDVTLTPTQYKQFASDGFGFYNQHEANLWAKIDDVKAITDPTKISDVHSVVWS